MDQKMLKELKRDLYRSLLLKPIEDISDTESEIAFQLAKDKDIQDILEAADKRDKDAEKMYDGMQVYITIKINGYKQKWIFIKPYKIRAIWLSKENLLAEMISDMLNKKNEM